MLQNVLHRPSAASPWAATSRRDPSTVSHTTRPSQTLQATASPPGGPSPLDLSGRLLLTPKSCFSCCALQSPPLEPAGASQPPPHGSTGRSALTALRPVSQPTKRGVSHRGPSGPDELLWGRCRRSPCPLLTTMRGGQATSEAPAAPAVSRVAQSSCGVRREPRGLGRPLPLAPRGQPAAAAPSFRLGHGPQLGALSQPQQAGTQPTASTSHRSRPDSATATSPVRPRRRCRLLTRLIQGHTPRTQGAPQSARSPLPPLTSEPARHRGPPLCFSWAQAAELRRNASAHSAILTTPPCIAISATF
ncbi:hypothetical protein NDU88_001478 [Pleurodeles waltl]|uniref:Uncharacterized protein n=1 Tax=Pleurodeles waltl TaxID=8319 RepID=A0AAV7NEV6_PLEWA|nr:hypothetical protein NDU88_001478 [Pleurodeles waltl]